MRRLRLIHYFGFSLLGACGGGDGLVAPNRDQRPDNPQAEAWMMSFEYMSDGAITCFTNVFPVTLVKEGATVSGAFGVVRLTCTGNSRLVNADLPSGQILNGSISDDTVIFDLGTPDRHQTGTLSRIGLRGAARWVLGDIILEGVWWATRPGGAV